ncbi:MAG: RNase adapter RapZ [Erysipelotrichaceae bacterium]|nr:RNase adapter RapZ [Erysipelotrichaceae bacterium]MCD8574606.1 RNase adapter RapZ [Erysipelotrichaceae bacterium]
MKQDIKRKRIVVVSGYSGAGKTVAMGILEDMGYTIMDQIPFELFEETLKLILTNDDPRFDFVALSTESLYMKKLILRLSNSEADVRVLFLEADEDVLLKRYKATRRTHPFLLRNLASSLSEAINVEIEMLSPLKEASTCIDTTSLSNQDLTKRLQILYGVESMPTFSISFMSFGFKHGIPKDADCVFDVRFIKNPFWEPELRPLTGNDQAVVDYVMGQEVAQQYLNQLIDFLAFSFPLYIQEGKNHVTVAVGCTGGKHRSVTLANALSLHFSKQYKVYTKHKDLGE